MDLQSYQVVTISMSVNYGGESVPVVIRGINSTSICNPSGVANEGNCLVYNIYDQVSYFTVFALSYDSSTNTFVTLPPDTPIYVGSYVGLSTVLNDTTYYLSTGPQSSTAPTNPIIWLQTNCWTTPGQFSSGNSAANCVWILTKPQTCVGTFTSPTLIEGGYTGTGNTALTMVANTPVGYAIQSLGAYVLNGGQSEYWSIQNSPDEQVYAYPLKNEQCAQTNLQDYTFYFSIQSCSGVTGCPTGSNCSQGICINATQCVGGCASGYTCNNSECEQEIVPSWLLMTIIIGSIIIGFIFVFAIILIIVFKAV